MVFTRVAFRTPCALRGSSFLPFMAAARATRRRRPRICCPSCLPPMSRRRLSIRQTSRLRTRAQRLHLERRRHRDLLGGLLGPTAPGPRAVQPERPRLAGSLPEPTPPKHCRAAPSTVHPVDRGWCACGRMSMASIRSAGLPTTRTAHSSPYRSTPGAPATVPCPSRPWSTASSRCRSPQAQHAEPSCGPCPA